MSAPPDSTAATVVIVASLIAEPSGPILMDLGTLHSRNQESR